MVILDTAGRLTVDEALMAEIAPSTTRSAVETLLVVDAMTGQEAVGVAQAFVAAVPVTGPDPDQDRRRRPRAARALDQRRHRRAGQVPRAPARRPTRSRSSTPTGSPAGSSAWATS